MIWLATCLMEMCNIRISFQCWANRPIKMHIWLSPSLSAAQRPRTEVSCAGSCCGICIVYRLATIVFYRIWLYLPELNQMHTVKCAKYFCLVCNTARLGSKCAHVKSGVTYSFLEALRTGIKVCLTWNGSLLKTLSLCSLAIYTVLFKS